MKTILSRFLIICLLLFSIIMVVLGINWQFFLQRELNIPTEGYTIIINPGENVKQVANMLYENNLLSKPKYFVWLSRLKGKDDVLRSGEYFLPHKTTPSQLLEKLANGDVMQHEFIIIEGWSIKETLATLSNNNKINHELDYRNQADIINSLDIDANAIKTNNTSLEGLFFPETYYFVRGTSDKELLKRAYRHMQSKLKEEWGMRDLDLPYKNSYEALIMASIIEKETSLSSERSEIAGVLVRRIKKSMRLQVDPTVIYGLGDNYSGKLSSSDLLKDSPYNTYMRHGLPITPIAMPSLESLQAALHPMDGESLYFVANSKGGGHVFSDTLLEHNKAVIKHLKSK